MARHSTCEQLFLRLAEREEERITVPDWLRSPELSLFPASNQFTSQLIKEVTVSIVTCTDSLMCRSQTLN